MLTSYPQVISCHLSFHQPTYPPTSLRQSVYALYVPRYMLYTVTLKKCLHCCILSAIHAQMLPPQTLLCEHICVDAVHCYKDGLHFGTLLSYLLSIKSVQKFFNRNGLSLPLPALMLPGACAQPLAGICLCTSACVHFPCTRHVLMTAAACILGLNPSSMVLMS